MPLVSLGDLAVTILSLRFWTHFEGIPCSKIVDFDVHFWAHFSTAFSVATLTPKRKTPNKNHLKGEILSRVRGGVNPPLREGLRIIIFIIAKSGA